MNFDARNAKMNSLQRDKLSDAIVRAGRGDRKAFETLYMATAAGLLDVCLRIFPDSYEAEEALQEAFLTIWNNAARFESGRGNPVIWLMVVTHNRAVDQLRAKKIVGTDPIYLAAKIADGCPLADAQIIKKTDNRILHDCISKLVGQEAFLIRSTFLDGLTYAEIAKQEGQPLGTIKAKIRRALLKLRGCIRSEQSNNSLSEPEGRSDIIAS
jgi:RNA polymerase sigma-70 factor (ECF subfamily)